MRRQAETWILSVVDCFDALTSDRPYRRRMTNDQAVAILVERRGTMYDPAIVDIFVQCYERLMPVADSSPHPVARTLGEARAPRPEHTEVSAVPAESAATSEVLAVASLARAVSGEATISDVGALTWMMLRQVVPCVSMAIFLYDDKHDAVTVQYADGAHAASMRGTRVTLGAGVAGWSAANRRFVLNADPVMDLGPAVASLSPPLRAALTMPLVRDNAVVAVISLYGSASDAFTDDHARLLALLAPSLATSIAGAAARRSLGAGGRRTAPDGRRWVPAAQAVRNVSRRSSPGPGHPDSTDPFRQSHAPRRARCSAVRAWPSGHSLPACDCRRAG